MVAVISEVFAGSRRLTAVTSQAVRLLCQWFDFRGGVALWVAVVAMCLWRCVVHGAVMAFPKLFVRDGRPRRLQFAGGTLLCVGWHRKCSCGLIRHFCMAWLCMMPLRRRRSMPECFGMHSGAVTVIIRGFVIGENRMADGATV